MGRVTVKYNIYKNEYPTRDGALTMEALDEELAISFGFPGAFVARLRPVDGERVFTCSPPGTAGLFENLPDGDYVLEVDEDPAEAVASVAVVAVARPADLAGKTRAANEVTATLRSMAPGQLAGAEYERLKAARDVEDVLFGGSG